MPHLSRFEILIAAAVAVVLVVAALAGLPQTLGAHPWWAQQTGIIGSAGGVVIYLGLRKAGMSPVPLLIIAAVALLATAAVAHFGKQVFAASMAENTLAGRFWYFGWFGSAGSMALVLCGGAAVLFGRARK